MESTVTSVLLGILKKHSISHVYGVPGAQVGSLMDGVSKDSYFTYVLARHEEAGPHMAHAYGRVTNSMAVCFGTTGPGSTNMVAAVQTARSDSIPMLVITANNPSRVIEPCLDGLQDSENEKIFSAVTKWNTTLRYPDRAPEIFNRAIFMARSGRPGPVHIDIPVDIFVEPCDYDSSAIPILAAPRPQAGNQEIAAVSEQLLQARRPLLIAGGGVARSGGSVAFNALVRSTGVPVVTTVNAKGVIESEMAGLIGNGGLYAGKPYERALREADLILAVGCKFSSFSLLGKSPDFPVQPGQKVIQVDIDAGMLGKSLPISQGVVADAKEFLQQLEAALPATQLSMDGDWVSGLMRDRKLFEQELAQITCETRIAGTEVLNEAAVVLAIKQCLPQDAIVSVDGGQVMMWANTLIGANDPYSVHYNPGAGHLGIGQPFANGAKLAFPDRPSVLVTGDGAMGFTVQELATASKYNLQTITFVLNDSRWAIYDRFSELFNNPDWGSELSDVDYVAIAQGFGCHGELVTALEDIPAAYDRAAAAGKPALIEVPVKYHLNPVNAYLGPATMPGVKMGPTPISPPISLG